MSRVQIVFLSTIGVIVSAMIYGVIISLTLAYIPLLIKTSRSMSLFMRNFLLTYVVVMTMFSTLFMITAIRLVSINLLAVPGETLLASSPESPITYRFESSGPFTDICFVLTSWGADGFMASIFPYQKI